MPTPSVVRFLEEPACTLSRDCGGKGANLARLTQAGFAVPAAFVVTGQAYAALVRSLPGLAGQIAALQGLPAAELPARAAAIRMRLAATPLPAALAAELAAAVTRLGAQRVSVRSSSTLEDLAEAAFAGQHDTYLAVAPEDVAARVRDCFASLFEERAVLYRARLGFSHAEARMAVVVQRMVESAVSGVAFTLDPVSGALDEVVVDAAFGLGEAVVSGEVTADHHRLSKATLAPLEERIGAKEVQIRSGEKGTVTVHEAAADRLALTRAQLQEVARTAVRIEEAFGFPQDVEWALDAGGALHVLQARPVTTIPPRWTRDESAERFPNAMTPLGWDFAEAGFHESLRHSLALMGFPPFPGKWFGLFDGYVYGNESAVKLFLGARRFPFRTADELRALLPRAREAYGWVFELPPAWARDLDRYLVGVGRLGGEPAPGADPRAHWARVLRVEALGREYFRPNIAISITHGFLHRALFQALALFFPAAEARALYDRLTRVCDTKTSAVNADLAALARAARADPGLAAALRERDSRALAAPAGLSDWPAFQARLERFLEDHGHRENDPDPYQPTWGEAPWVVLDQLKVLVAREEEEAPGDRELRARAAQAEAELELLPRLPEDLRFFFSELLRLARAYSALDDLEHYQSTRLQRLFRRALLEMGRSLAGQGLLAREDDLFFARRAELEAAVASGDFGPLRAAAAAGRTAYDAALRRSPPWTLGADEPAAAAEGALRGIPGSPGVAEAPVFVVRSVEDFPRFPRGAVLVARTTNPSWTPLFHAAAAVITESGGPLSHGAVTARELGLPAVMAVKGCMALPDGAVVRVDGARGEVVRR
ncbi:MAG: PEP/pyruvate-binding domain-containing protein [Anaeromyxobacter sp.]